ncbi:MAG: hypothetical protein CL920_36535 [Deltaproteobacteria bacterium]|nr:hypothetical protein [Deltaproteobacteria bacterium]MBU54238.1 hypothetical protein [Deltaproteobacteria bacterium]
MGKTTHKAKRRTKTYNIEVGHKARPYGKKMQHHTHALTSREDHLRTECSCAYFARGPLTNGPAYKVLTKSIHH